MWTAVGLIKGVSRGIIEILYTVELKHISTYFSQLENLATAVINGKLLIYSSTFLVRHIY